MAYSPTSIANAAMDLLPTAQMVTYNEDTVQGRAARRQYPLAVAELLEKGDWRFARRRAPLAIVDNDRAAQWGFAYAMPADLAVPIRVLPDLSGSAPIGDFVALVGQVYAYPMVPHQEPGQLYDIAGNVLYTDVQQATLEYITQGPNTADFPPSFIKALYYDLASKLAMPILKSSQRQQALEGEAAAMLGMAIQANNNRQPMRYGDFAPDAIRARDGWYDGVVGAPSPWGY